MTQRRIPEPAGGASRDSPIVDRQYYNDTWYGLNFPYLKGGENAWSAMIEGASVAIGNPVGPNTSGTGLTQTTLTQSFPYAAVDSSFYPPSHISVDFEPSEYTVFREYVTIDMSPRPSYDSYRIYARSGYFGASLISPFGGTPETAFTTTSSLPATLSGAAERTTEFGNLSASIGLIANLEAQTEFGPDYGLFGAYSPTVTAQWSAASENGGTISGDGSVRLSFQSIDLSLNNPEPRSLIPYRPLGDRNAPTRQLFNDKY